MKLGSFRKYSVEKKRYTIDYADWLDTGETVGSVALSVTTPTAGTGVQAALTTSGSSLLPNGTALSFFVQDGADNAVYTVHVRMTSSAGQIKEDHLQFSIDEDLA